MAVIVAVPAPTAVSVAEEFLCGDGGLHRQRIAHLHLHRAGGREHDSSHGRRCKDRERGRIIFKDATFERLPLVPIGQRQ